MVEIYVHGSPTGFKGLAAELCEIGMASRKIKEKEVVENHSLEVHHAELRTGKDHGFLIY